MTLSAPARALLLSFATLIFAAGLYAGDAPVVLVFTKTKGFHHGSIAIGSEAITKLGADNGFTVKVTDDSSIFTADGLAPISAVVSLSTTGNGVFEPDQKEAFIAWFKKGHGWVGIHAASDCEYDWPWYHGLVGAYFKGHPGQQQATINVVDRTFPATCHLPKTWVRTDEWYNFRALPEDVHVLLKIDEGSYTGGDMNGDHPMAWWHLYQGGRAFYTELGHTDDSYRDPVYLKHILGGILWAIGREPSKVTPDPE